MKILYIVTQGEQGGAQIYTKELATGMIKKGHDVYVATGRQTYEKDTWLHKEMELHGQSKNKNIIFKNLIREISPLTDLKAFFEMRKFIKDLKPDVVHLNSSKAGVIGAFASFLISKSIYTVHGFVFLEPMNIIKKLIYITLEFNSSLFRNFTILINKKDLQVGRRLFIIRNNFKIIYNGLKNEYLNKIEERHAARKFIFEKISIPDENQKIVGIIANFYETKGLKYFVDSAKEISENDKDTIFVHIGFGNEKVKTEIENKIKEYGFEKKVFLLGKIPSAFKYLSSFHTFLLTSVKEGMPYTLLEAHLAGCHIVSTDVGGIREMSEYIEINLAKTKDVKDVSEKVLKTLNKEIKSKQNLPEIFTYEKMLDDTKEVYKSLLK